MSTNIKRNAPYYDDYDSSKQYTHLLAIPGRVAQAREITQVQSVVKDIIKGIGDSVFKDGNIVEGCQVTVNKYRTGSMMQSIRSSTDKVEIPAPTLSSIIKVFQGDRVFVQDIDYSLVSEDSKYYIEWRDTTNYPIFGENYEVYYAYDLNDITKSLTVSAGKVYMHGMILPVKETTIVLPTGQSSGKLGFKLREDLITENEDSTLRDPAQGYDNYNQPGCHRVRSSIEIVWNDADSSDLVELIDGEIASERYAPEYDILSQTLATRTREESGSYIVRGFNTTLAEDKTDSTKMNASVDAGIAYVNGYRVETSSSRKVSISRSLQYRGTTISYPYDGADIPLSTGGTFIESLTELRGKYNSGRIEMSAPTSNTSSQTIKLPSNSLPEFYAYDNSSNNSLIPGGSYVHGTDYRVELDSSGSGNYVIKWLGTSKYPTSTYYIEYRYTAKFKQGRDYELSISNGIHTVHWISGGFSPIVDTDVSVDYNVYLARKDLLTINQSGTMSVIEGVPALYGTETLPEYPTDAIVLAHILHTPGGSYNDSKVANVALTRFTMKDIQRILSRIETIEYNQTVSSLESDSKDRAVAGTRKSIFTDPLIDFSKVDYTYNRTSDGSKEDGDKPFHNSAVDFESNICYLPVLEKLYDLNAPIDTAGSFIDSNNTVKKYGRLVTLSTGSTDIILSQNKATRTFLINPYEKFPQIPEISLSPAVDSWIDSNVIEVPKSYHAEEVIQTSTKYVNKTTGYRSNAGVTTTYKDTPINTRVEVVDTTDSIVNERSITYIRPREVTIEGAGFPRNLDNIKCYFEGVQLPITPIAGTNTTVGTEPNTVKASSQGTVSAKFNIPEDTFFTGIREVRLEGTVPPGYSASEGIAYALYQATGSIREIERTVSTLYTVLLNRVTTVTTTTYVDPIGQTFVLDRMTILSGIDLYFESAPDNEIPVTCDIREVQNGNITSKILGHKTMPASEVRKNISSDSSKATRFLFDDPVVLEGNTEYAFVVRSSSSAYRLWVAELGESDVRSGESVVANPYLIGVMMSSSNNSSWTAHQTTDIKFQLLADRYDDSSELVFDNISAADDFSRLYLIADSFIPEGSTINWSYSTDNGGTYNNVAPYNMTALGGMKSQIKLKASISKDPTIVSPNLSPIIALDSISASLSSYYTEGSYVSIEFPGNSYNKATIFLDTYLPAETSLDVYISSDNGATKKKATLANSSPLNYGWEEHRYEVSMDSVSTSCKLIIEMNSETEFRTPSFRRARVITHQS